MAWGSCVPRSTNTRPFSPKEKTRHTLVETMFIRETDGRLARGEMTFTKPPATTAMMPLTWMDSAMR